MARRPETIFDLRRPGFAVCTRPMIVYLNGRFLPKDEATISPDDRGFLFGDGVYEVLHGYDGHVFRAGAHWRRLRKCLDELRIPGCDGLDYDGIAAELVRLNQVADNEALIYLQVSRGPAPRKHAFPADPRPTVYGFAMPFAPTAAKRERGYRAITVPDERWLRCHIKAISLLGNVLANQAAADAGVDESIMIRDGRATEGSHSTFAAVFDGVIWTAPLGNLILPSITREVLMEICAANGYPVREEFPPEARLAAADELMVWSTTTEVMPVVELNGRPVGGGQPGPVARQLHAAFLKVLEAEKGMVAA